MKIDGTAYRTVWVDHSDGWSIRVIDQTKLPWSLEFVRITGLREAAHAIRSMQVRGAPLIGAMAAYGLALALREDPGTTRWSGRPSCSRDPADRGEPALGARPHADPAAEYGRLGRVAAAYAEAA